MEDKRREMTGDTAGKDNRLEMAEGPAGDEMIGEFLERLGPSDQQKEDMWRRIEAAADPAGEAAELREVKAGADLSDKVTVLRAGKSEADIARKAAKVRGMKNAARVRRNIILRRAFAVAASLLLIIGGVTWVGNKGGADDVPALTGNVYAAESRVTDMSVEELLVSVGDPAAVSSIYVYAPKVYYLDDQRLVFGNATGLIIYDLKNDCVAGLIDMQAICSGYFNSDTIRTHVLVEGDTLTVYNTRGLSEELTDYGESTDAETVQNSDEPFGYYHTFDLSKPDGGLLTASGAGKEKAVFAELMEKGAAFEGEVYADAWDNIAFLQSSEMEELIGLDDNSYSELAYMTGANGNVKAGNVLISRGSGYELLTEQESGAVTAKKLNLGITDSVRETVKKQTALPAYRYTGDEAAVGAICNALAADQDSLYGDENDGGVNIPAPIIYGMEKSGDELLVFGNFWVERYIRQGNTLVSTSGGEMPACYHLRETADGYEIASVDAAGDGEMYTASIEEFTRDYPQITKKFFSEDNSKARDREKVAAVKAYSDASDLGIKYIKDFGWDPVELK